MDRYNNPADPIGARVLKALQAARARIETLERDRAEALAIVGLGCRFPGHAADPEGFWQVLSQGTDAISEVPPERWDIEALHAADPDAPGKMVTRCGGFLPRVDGFDAPFFGISRKEAVGMDPQQRLLLEVAWEALENAGLAPSALRGTPGGVFIGIGTFDYAALRYAQQDFAAIDPYFATGGVLSVAAGRLSYALGWTGPSMAVDTACSSSLVAVHLACQSLRRRECDLALAGGVNVILRPELSINFSRARMLAPDGRCKTFDAAADGYVRGEGCGVLVLKRLSDALAQGDRILALIRGSAVNQDGPSAGLTVPNGPSQEEVIRRALADAGAAAGEVGYIEAHGTGTALGDPIEVASLGKVFGGRPADDPLLLGSVKTNIGHLEAAAGIAGLIKVVLALQHGQIPAHLHLRQPNPHIEWDRLPFEIPTRSHTWPAAAKRLAGVSAFGASGTNAHVVLQQAPARETRSGAVERPLHLLALSARSQAALQDLAGRYAEWLCAGHFQEHIADVCFTANAGRSHFEQRLALVGATAAGLAVGCRAFQEGRPAEGLQTGERQGDPKIAFVFGAEGAYAGMGRALYATAPAFRAALERCDALLQGKVLRELYGAGAEDVSPAALVAVQFALCELWQSWGVAPALVMGRGAGEIAAACVAGMLPLEQALGQAAGSAAAVPALADPHIGLVSCASGALLTKAPARPQEWLRGISGPGDKGAAMQTLRHHGCTLLLEIGPHVELGEKVLPGLRQGHDAWRCMLEPLGALYTQGATVDWQGFDRDYARSKVAAPTYPFQRQRYWIEESAKAPQAVAVQPAPTCGHPLLGQQLATARGDVIFSARIARQAPAFLNDHRIHGAMVFPATGYIEMALAAGALLLDSETLVIEDVAIRRPLIVPEDADLAMQAIVRPETDEALLCEIFSEGPGGRWRLHATARVRRDAAPDWEAQPLAALQPCCTQPHSTADHYRRFARQGIAYGPAFQGLEQLLTGKEQSLGRLRAPAAVAAQMAVFRLHPGWLDAALQAGAPLLPGATGQDNFLPIGLKRLRVRGACGHTLWSHARRQADRNGNDTQLLDFCLYDESGRAFVQVEGFTLKRATRDMLPGAEEKEPPPLYTERWQPAPLVQATHAAQEQALAGRWLILADAGGLGERLAQALQAAGAETVLAYHGQGYAGESGRFQLDALAPQDFAHLLAEAFDGRDCAGVVHLWSLDSGARTDLSAIAQGKVLGCASVLHLVQALGKSAQAPRLWLATRGAQPAGDTSQAVAAHQTPLWGLQRVLALEHPELRSACLDLDPTPAADDVAQLLAELASTPDGEDRIAYRGGQRCVARLVRAAAPARAKSACRRMMINDYGILEHLTLAPMQPRPAAQGEVQIAVRATGLNLRDVLRALGMLKDYEPQLRHAPDARFGFECAGTVTAVGEEVGGLAVGDEVIAALTEEGSLGSHVTVQAGRVVKRPAGLSPAEGATIPLAFLTALYGLAHLAGLKEGERVLIHAAAGGVGLAAVQIAKRAGARIYATASEGKWDYVKSLGVEAVFNSRSLDYAEQIMALTEGQGVDVVLNSLTGAYIPRNLAILSENGRFVEIGKIGVWDAAQVARKRPDVRYHPFDLGDVARSDPALLQRLLRDLMAAFAAGELTPLKHTVFRLADGAAAFRYMAQARHIGKVVIESDAAADMRIRPDATYLITGGLGALGLETARWLASRGAAQLVLVGRSAASAAAQTQIGELERAGVRVKILCADIAQASEVARLLAAIADLPPLKGIIHAAGVLDDGLLDAQDVQRLRKAMAPKGDGAWHLHAAVRTLPLDFFVCYSSAAALLGSAGQANYAAANAFLDALVHVRRAQGLHGLSVAWGPWALGMAAGLDARGTQRIAAQGFKPIAAAQGFGLLEQLLRQDATCAAVLPLQWDIYLKHHYRGALPPFFAALSKEEKTAQPQAAAEPSAILRRLSRTAAGQRRAVLLDYLQAQVAAALGEEGAQGITPRQRLFDLGIDSLMAVDLKNRLQADLGVALEPTLVFDYPTIEALGDYLLPELGLGAAPESASKQTPAQDRTIKGGAADPAPADMGLEEASQDEIARMLAEELEAGKRI